MQFLDEMFANENDMFLIPCNCPLAVAAQDRCSLGNGQANTVQQISLKIEALHTS